MSKIALIMAAGKGTRMRSELPKVLHPVGGRPMLHWVADAALAAGCDEVVCITRPGSGVDEQLPAGAGAPAHQLTGEGTGAAVLAARDRTVPGDTILVLSGDNPLIDPDILGGLLAAHHDQKAAMTLLTTCELEPDGYGRIVRGPAGNVERIVETKDPTGVPQAILDLREVNVGVYAFRAEDLWSALEQVGETSGELYLTDVLEVLVGRGARAGAFICDDPLAAMGVNTPEDLEVAEQLLAARQLRS